MEETEMERVLREQVKALTKDRDRLLRKADSQEQEIRLLKELVRVKQVRQKFAKLQEVRA